MCISTEPRNSTHFGSRLSDVASPAFEFDVQDPWRGQVGSTETTSAVSHPLSHDVEPFQVSPWLFEGQNSGFPTPGSTANLFLGEPCLDSLDTQAELKSSGQDLSFGIPLPSNHWNSSGKLESQPWAVSTGQTRTSVPSHAITRPLTFTNNLIDFGFDINSYSYAQGIKYSAPDSDLNLQVSNFPAIGPHSLDFFSMDVGQASFEMLMPACDNSQDLVFGSGRTFSDPTVYQDLLQSNSVSSLPNGHTFDFAGFQHAQLPQGQTQASQTEAQVFPVPTALQNQPNLVPQLPARASTFACAHGNCNQAFGRKSDLARHRKSVHGVNHIKFFCHIPGCSKGRGHGEGYSRDDKLTEHLWKKHGNLGYTKSR